MILDNFRAVRASHSLVVRLVAVAIAMVLVGGALRYVITEITLRDGIAEVVNAQQASMATYVANDINAKVLARRHLLEHLAASLPQGTLATPDVLQRWLATQSAIPALFSLGVVVIPSDGKSGLADYPSVAGRLKLDFNDRDWFRAALATGTFSVGRPTIGRAVGVAVVNMAVPIRGADDRIVGVIMGVTALNAPGFLGLVENGLVGNTGGMLLVSPRDKLFVTASAPAMRLQPTPAEGINPLHDKAMAGWRGTGTTTNAQGISELSAVADIPSAQWFLVARTPSAEVFATVDRLLGNVLKGSALAITVVVVFLVFFLSYMFRPLVDSAVRMRAMARGDVPLEALPVVRDDEVGAMVKSFNDLVEQQRLAQERMAYLAHHDPLTALPNRLAFHASMAQSLALAERQKGSLAVLFLDLDGFKRVNDTHGHETGDALLLQVAQRLRECVRASDVVGRMGGDEFVILLTDNPNLESASTIARKVIAHLTETYSLGPLLLSIGASVGIAVYPKDATSLDGLLAQADDAMYVAKRDGGNRFQTVGGSANPPMP
jgi:diguanylate cyclase (GGDEF)-like protein